MTYAINRSAPIKDTAYSVSRADIAVGSNSRRRINTGAKPNSAAPIRRDTNAPAHSDFLDKNEAQLRDYYRRKAEYERSLKEYRPNNEKAKSPPQSRADRTARPNVAARTKRTPASNYRLDGAYISREKHSNARTPAKDYTVIGRAVSSNRELRRGVHIDEAQREYEIKRKEYINLKLYRERKKQYELARERSRKNYYEAIRRAIIDEHRAAVESANKAKTKEKRKNFAIGVFQKIKAPMIVALVVITIASGLFGIYKNVFVLSEIRFDTGGLYDESKLLEASGIGIGDNLYSFSSQVVANTLTLHFPQIKSFDVKRKAPSSIYFTAQTESNAFYTEIYGETYYVSRSLRLLGKVSPSEAKASGAINLKLPKISTAIAGSEIAFDESRIANISKLLLEAVLQSEMSERIKSIDLRDVYDITLICDDLYLLEFGNVSDASLKLKIAAAVLRDEMFNGSNKASLDLSSTDETGVIIDNQLDLSY